MHEHDVVRRASRTSLAVERVLDRRSHRLRFRVRVRGATQRLRVWRRFRIPELTDGAIGLGDRVPGTWWARADWEVVLPPDPAAVQRRYLGSHNTHRDAPFPDASRSVPIARARKRALFAHRSPLRSWKPAALSVEAEFPERSGAGRYGVQVSRELNWANMPAGFGAHTHTCLS